MVAHALRSFQDRTVVVERDKLLRTLRENREKHIREYEAARQGYREAAIQQLEEAEGKAIESLSKRVNDLRREIRDLEPGDISPSDHMTLIHQSVVKIDTPVSFVDAYDTAIKMFEWETSEKVELTGSEFACFVEDKWDWREEFIGKSAAYLA